MKKKISVGPMDVFFMLALLPAFFLMGIFGEPRPEVEDLARASYAQFQEIGPEERVLGQNTQLKLEPHHVGNTYEVTGHGILRCQHKLCRLRISMPGADFLEDLSQEKGRSVYPVIGPQRTVNVLQVSD